MASEMDELEKKVLKLSSHERAIIAYQLIRSLDEEEDIDDEDLEKLWIKEINARYDNYKKGKTAIKPAEQVFREARSRNL